MTNNKFMRVILTSVFVVIFATTVRSVAMRLENQSVKAQITDKCDKYQSFSIDGEVYICLEADKFCKDCLEEIPEEVKK